MARASKSATIPLKTMEAWPFLHEHRGPVSLAACVGRFMDTSGENGSRPGVERGPFVEDERGSGVSNPK